MLACVALLASAPGSPLAAQEHIRSISLSGGLAGSIDEDSTGFSNPAFQLRFAVETSPRGNLGVRLGRMDFDDAGIGPVTEMTVDYLAVVGEYLFDEPSHDSGLFAGLGFFDLDATRVDGGRDSDEGSIGLLVGALGEFKVGERWFIYGEGFATYTGLDVAQVFATLQVGFGFRF
jgi:hypothetical protein